jgi:hypothetical protein
MGDCFSKVELPSALEEKPFEIAKGRTLRRGLLLVGG